MQSKSLISLLAVIVITGAPGLSTAATGPMDQVKATVDAIIDLLKDRGLDKEVRHQRIRSMLEPHFHFQAMSRGALASHWKKASAEEKTRFVKLFSDLLENTYVGRIEAYTDERVEYVKETIKGKRSVVDTKIITKTTTIPIQYKLIPEGDEWLVYDILVEGVSLVRNFRNTYGDIVRKEGMAGLLAKMEAKLKDR